ncbi:hypothetical protein H632_c1630p1 [Helicosporidium sp. ATCC 50920]|nr:hypothetical protein H632_c1630p1 [Helicosporidium sp. ATCC 50920]|eukprot:KDD74040.1 hypothetical protein H632_c1630p1 [Helicosporidium sp. ATCC 50920]
MTALVEPPSTVTGVAVVRGADIQHGHPVETTYTYDLKSELSAGAPLVIFEDPWLVGCAAATLSLGHTFRAEGTLTSQRCILELVMEDAAGAPGSEGLGATLSCARSALFAVQQDLAAAEVALEAERAHQAEEELAFQAREASLKARDETLQASMLRCARFFEETESKRRKAVARTAAEEAACVDHAAQMVGLERDLETVREEKQRLRDALEQNEAWWRLIQEATHLRDPSDEGSWEDLVKEHEDARRVLDVLTRQRTVALHVEAETRQESQEAKQRHREVMQRLWTRTARLRVEAREASEAAQLAGFREHAKHAQHVQQARQRWTTQILLKCLYRQCVARSALGHSAEESDPGAQAAVVAQCLADWAVALSVADRPKS